MVGVGSVLPCQGPGRPVIDQRQTCQSTTLIMIDRNYIPTRMAICGWERYVTRGYWTGSAIPASHVEEKERLQPFGKGNVSSVLFLGQIDFARAKKVFGGEWLLSSVWDPSTMS